MTGRPVAVQELEESMRHLIEIRHRRGGQPRPYADAVFEAEITCFVAESLNDANGQQLSGFYRRLSEEVVKDLCRLFVRPFDDPPKDTFSARLEVCEPIGPTREMEENPSLCRPQAPAYRDVWAPKHDSRWLVRVREPYCD